MRSANSATVISTWARAFNERSRLESQIVQGVDAAAEPVGHARGLRTSVELHLAHQPGVIAVLSHLVLEVFVILRNGVEVVFAAVAVLIRRAVAPAREGPAPHPRAAHH